MKAGVIYNPQARANKKPDNWLEFWRGLDVDLQVIEKDNSLTKITDHFLDKKFDLVFISGGDGTVQHLQTEMGNRASLSHKPVLCLLPHGTTNMTASDIGLHPATKSRIQAITSRKDYLKRATHIKKRRTIKVENVKDKPPQFGVFFGAGALCEAVKKFHSGKDKQQLTGHLATGKILVFEIISALRAKNTEGGDIYRGYDIRANIDDEKMIEGDQLLLLIATLDKLILGSEPFWNLSGDGLKLTSIAWPLKRNLIRTVYDIMFAQNKSLLHEPDFLSKSCHKIELVLGDAGFTMDGELFECVENTPLHISLGPEFTYLCG